MTSGLTSNSISNWSTDSDDVVLNMVRNHFLSFPNLQHQAWLLKKSSFLSHKNTISLLLYEKLLGVRVALNSCCVVFLYKQTTLPIISPFSCRLAPSLSSYRPAIAHRSRESSHSHDVLTELKGSGHSHCLHFYQLHCCGSVCRWRVNNPIDNYHRPIERSNS